MKTHKPICDNKTEYIFEHMACLVYWKDKKSHYLGCNQAFANAVGLAKAIDIVGKTDKELPWIGKYQSIIQSDLAALRLGQVLTIETLLLEDGQTVSMLTNKKRLDNISRTKIAIIGSGIMIDSVDKLKKLTLSVNNLKIPPRAIQVNKKWKFSARETECLFYLLRGKTAKQTAVILKISGKTVEFYIANIKHKLNVFSKAELIDKAIQKGLLEIIPKGLINKELIKKDKKPNS